MYGIGKSGASVIWNKYVREHMPWVSVFYLFFNIRIIGTALEKADEKTKRQAVEKACTLSNAHSFIIELSEAYDTHIRYTGR